MKVNTVLDQIAYHAIVLAMQLPTFYLWGLSLYNRNIFGIAMAVLSTIVVVNFSLAREDYYNKGHQDALQEMGIRDVNATPPPPAPISTDPNE